MSDRSVSEFGTRCLSPEINRRLAAYCFEDLSESERRLFEAHLLDCDFCWAEVQRLSAAVQAMRSDKDLLRSLSVADVSSVLGISAKFDWRFGGHTPHVVLSSMLYALGYAVLLLVEVAYAFENLGTMALKLAPVVFLWISCTSILALALEVRSVREGRRNGLLVSIGVFSAAAALLYAWICQFLPTSAITQLRIQPYTAQAAYLKGIRYLLPLAILYIAIPFHFVIVMQRELREGRHRLSLGLLSGEKWAVAPVGAFYISIRTLWIVLVLALLASIPMAAGLFGNLVPGPQLNLFSNLLQLRWVLYFGLGVECLAWYSRALNELKREGVAVEMTTAGWNQP